MIRIGIDRVTDPPYASLLSGLRLGLVSNMSGISPRHGYRATPDILPRLCRVSCLFAPEHGVRGILAPGERVEDGRDELTDLPVYSLFEDKVFAPAGEEPTRYSPRAEALRGLDALVFDMQDVGSRYFTYASTLLYVLRACAERGLPLILLDRPNPLGGTVIEGGRQQADCTSFIGLVRMPIRHSLTLGELARYCNEYYELHADLTIIPCEGLTRTMTWQDTGLPFVKPSPNLPSPSAVTVYNGTCMLAGTNVSEGRGTTTPFTTIGAPFIHPERLADALTELELPGLAFSPIYFRPFFGKYTGEVCRGVDIHVTDAAAVRAVSLGVYLVDTLRPAVPLGLCLHPAARPAPRHVADRRGGLRAGGRGLPTLQVDLRKPRLTVHLCFLRNAKRDLVDFSRHFCYPISILNGGNAIMTSPHDQPRAPQTGETIRRLRRAAGLSQEELAERLDVSRQSVSLWEQGNTQPTLENLRSMTEILHTDFNTLLGGAVPPEAPAEDVPTEDPPTEVTPPPSSTVDPLCAERRALQKSIGFRETLSVQLFLLPLWLFLGLIVAAAVSSSTGRISDDMGGLLVLVFLIGAILSVVFGVRQRRILRRRMAEFPPEPEPAPVPAPVASPAPATAPTSEPVPATAPSLDAANPPAPSSRTRPTRTTGESFLLSAATGLSVCALVSWLAALLLLGSHAWESILPFLTGTVLLEVSALLLWIGRLIHLLRKQHTTQQPHNRQSVRVPTLVGPGLLVCFFLLRGITLLGLSFAPTLYLYAAALLCLLASDVVMLVDGWRG